MAERRVGSPYLSQTHGKDKSRQTPQEEEEMLTERFKGSLEKAGDVLAQQPGRLLRAQQIGEQRLRGATQKAMASQVGTGPLGAGQLGAVADVGATRGMAEAEFGVKSEQAIADAAFRAAQGDAEIASALQEVGDSAKIREMGMQIMMLRASGASRSEIQDYIDMESKAASSSGVRKFLEQKREDLEPEPFFQSYDDAGGLLGFVGQLSPAELVRKALQRR